MSDRPLPDKCKHCGLRVKYDFKFAGQSMTSDTAFGELHQLHKAGFVPEFRRRVTESNTDFGSTEICAISSSAWLKANEICKHWVLRIEGASIADYLSIFHDKRNYRVTILGIAIALLTFLIGLAMGTSG